MADFSENYAEYLHQHNIKSTRPRNLVLHILMTHEGIMTAEEIYRALAAIDENVNFSTVYRVLELFTDKDIIENLKPEVAKQLNVSRRSVIGWCK